ncbi:hypothetical protein RJT34_19000 [Clitoria ternatea]|uniref:glutathione transferase n=1 Tax=Clitoria ternatea TaxID=43366 RepID=A0AAN9IQ78_CLITE
MYVAATTGLQDQIQLVPIDLKNRPSWYKEKVYPKNKVPSLEHNGKVLGESLDLIRYIDANFEGTPLFPSEANKIDGYKQTKVDRNEYLEAFKKKFLFICVHPHCRLNGEHEMLLCSSVQEIRPPTLNATSEPPPLFDGTTRLYICYMCPYAQRAWIARNCKGLQDQIQLVPIDLKNRPSWYKEKVYPKNKVPSLEHNGKVLGESLDLIRYIDANFEGTPLFPSDPAKREYGEQLISYVDTFTNGIYSSLKGDTVQETSAAFDYLESALSKFDDGPFFLGQFSLADIAYVSFLERFQIIFPEIFKHDITAGRPKLATWIEEANKIDGYKQTKVDRNEYLEAFKKKFLVL